MSICIIKNKFFYISVIFISVIFAISIPLNQLSAVVEVNDATVSQNTAAVKNNTDRIAKLLAGEENNKGTEYFRLQAQEKLPEVKNFLKQTINNIINWVNTSFAGQPAYIVNTLSYLKTIAFSVTDNFLNNEPALDSVCEPFKDDVKRGVGTASTFQEQIECTFTDTVKKEAFDNGDFIGGGGWDAWLKTTLEPQNNPLGASVIAQNERDRRVEASQEAAKLEATWGSGFMSLKFCDRSKANWDIDYDGCDIKTPGEVIASTLNSANSSNLRQMETANDFNEISFVLSDHTYYTDPGPLSTRGLNAPAENSETLTEIYNRYKGFLNNLIDLASDLFGSNGKANFDEAIDGETVDKDLAVRLIDLQTGVESQYFDAQLNISNLLNTSLNVFASSTCSVIIKNNVSNQITGSIVYNQTAPGNLIWNINDVNRVSGIVVNNVNILNAARAGIISTADSPAAIAIIQNLIASESMHSNPEVVSYSTNGNIFDQIKGWIINNLNTASASCNINKVPLAEWGIN